MSLDLEPRLRAFFASAPQNIRSVATLQISHSAMSTTYYLWREPYAGQITLETGAVVAVQPMNFEITLAGTAPNLDQIFTIKIDTVDIADDLRDELDLIPIGTKERVAVVYREYLSDDLTEPEITAALQIENISFSKGAATITAGSPRLNSTTTGEVYSPRDIPMLRGFNT